MRVVGVTLTCDLTIRGLSNAIKKYIDTYNKTDEIKL
jgi:hypothetical protein